MSRWARAVVRFRVAGCSSAVSEERGSVDDVARERRGAEGHGDSGPSEFLGVALRVVRRVAWDRVSRWSYGDGGGALADRAGDGDRVLLRGVDADGRRDDRVPGAGAHAWRERVARAGFLACGAIDRDDLGGDPDPVQPQARGVAPSRMDARGDHGGDASERGVRRGADRRYMAEAHLRRDLVQ